jgi:hypothetical protein
MSKCTNCGNDNLENAKFCDNCGMAIEHPPSVGPAPIYAPAPPHVPPPAPTPAPTPVPGMAAGPARASVRSKGTGKEYLLDPGRESMMGRGDRAHDLIPEVELNDAAALAQGVSRLHAKIIFHNGIFFLVDLGSTNRTYLNGSALTPQQPYGLSNGDSIELGSYKLSFHQ